MMRIQLPQTMYYQDNDYTSVSGSDSSYSGEDSPTREMAPFLRNLRNMLALESPQIISWTKDGTAFEIHDMARMTDQVLPKYFKHNKYTSFQRQLNYFHFKKWTKSRSSVCTFSNPMFVRDAPSRSLCIRRKRSGSRELDTPPATKEHGFQPNSWDNAIAEATCPLIRDDLSWLADFDFMSDFRAISEPMWAAPEWTKETGLCWSRHD